jgi:hypothetical protein
MVVGGAGGRGDVKKFQVSSFKLEVKRPPPLLMALGGHLET